VIGSGRDFVCEVPELLKIAKIIPIFKKGKEINPEITAQYLC